MRMTSAASEQNCVIDRKLTADALKENPGGIGGVWVNRRGGRLHVE